MERTLSILLAVAMTLALTSCGTGSQPPAESSGSAGSVSVSSSETSSDAVSEVSGVMDALYWTVDLPDPGKGVDHVEMNGGETVIQIYMDESWSVERAREYTARYVELGFQLYNEVESEDGTYYSEGYLHEYQKGVVITYGYEGADIVLTYGDQL